MKRVPNNFAPFLGETVETCDVGHATIRSGGLKGEPCPVCKKHETPKDMAVGFARRSGKRK